MVSIDIRLMLRSSDCAIIAKMHIEDMIENLIACRRELSREDRTFFTSLARRTQNGKALTSRQGWVVLKIFREKHLYGLLGMRPDAYREILAKPAWRNPLTESVVVKSEVRHLVGDYLGFRTSSSSRARPHFDAMQTVYSHGMNIAHLNSTKKLNAAIAAIGEIGFEMDSKTENWLARALDSQDPVMATVHEDTIIIDVPDCNPISAWLRHVMGAQLL